jgi:uracil-DNA glycosylase
MAETLKNLSDDWINVLATPDLEEILENIDHCVPAKDKIFEFARLTDYDQIKIVIIGQDPYPNPGDAHGLAFSSKADKVPASLKNIFKAIGACGEGLPLPSADLTCWAQQGVLLLNTALTTLPNKSKAHANLWKEYTDQLIQRISEDHPRAIFFLWGQEAKKKLPLINGIKLTYAHPSPLAQATQKFQNCDHFRVANEILVALGETPIEWGRGDEQQDEKTNEPDWFRSGSFIFAFTDGSCVKNGKKNSKGGFSVCFPEMDEVILGPIDSATNIRAEGEAIHQALKFYAYQLKHGDPRNLAIMTDSEFWIKMFENYMPRWHSRGIDFAEKKNPDMTVPMWRIYQKILGKKFSKRVPVIKFQFVPSHDKCNWSEGNEYERFCFKHNEEADVVAKIAREKADEVWRGPLADVLEENDIPEYETDSE